MQTTIDISMYPNREEFIPPIKGFIERINQYPDIKVKTFPTSTVVQGEFEAASAAVQQTIADCYREYGMAIYVVKYIPGYQAL